MSNDPLQIGVTGGIGSGKSTVCKIFSIFGVPGYNADLRARWLMENDPDIVSDISGYFGVAAYKNGRLDRDLIANVSFNDDNALKRLNEIVHPAVASDFTAWVGKFSGQPYVIKEAALLFESGSFKHLHKTINVSAPVDMRIKRVVKRDPFRSQAEVSAIIEKQFPEEKRNQLADYIIKNDNARSLIQQVVALHEIIINLDPVL